jgi:hypothetical protein
MSILIYVLACIIVLVISQFILSYGIRYGSLISGLLLIFLPTKTKFLIGGLLAGVLGGTSTVAVGYFIFTRLTGSFGTLPIVITILPTIPPILLETGRYNKLKRSEKILHPTTVEMMDTTSTSVGSAVIGAVAGLLIGIFVCLK